MLSSATMADRAVLKRTMASDGISGGSVTMADRAVLKRNSTSPLRLSSSATVADRASLKLHSADGQLDGRFSNHGRSGKSQTVAVPVASRVRFSNHGRSGKSQTAFCRRSAGWTVQQPWQIGQVSNLWVQIPRLNRDYLFQRTAKSARSSCFCDPPGHFSIRLSDLRKRLFPP